MTERSIPWAGKVLGDAGAYDFDEWWQIWMDLFGGFDSFQPNLSGMIPGQEPTLASTVAATPLLIGPMRAFVQGAWYESTAQESITVATPAGSTRPDLLVLRKSQPDQTVRLTLIGGVEGAAQPPDPVQSDGSTWDMPVAKVSITTGGAITLAPAFPILPVGPGGSLSYVRHSIREHWISVLDDIAGNGILHGDAGAWAVTIVTTASVDVATAVDEALGQIDLQSGATINSQVQLLLGGEAGGAFDGAWDFDIAMRVKQAEGIVQTEFACGIGSIAGTVDRADGIYLHTDHGAAEVNWEGIVRKDGSETSTDLGNLADGFFHTVEARKRGQAGSETVQWFVDGSAVGAAVATNVPGQGDFMLPFFWLENTVGADKTTQCDFLDVEISGLSANHINPATDADRSLLLNVTA